MFSVNPKGLYIKKKGGGGVISLITHWMREDYFSGRKHFQTVVLIVTSILNLLALIISICSQ